MMTWVRSRAKRCGGAFATVLVAASRSAQGKSFFAFNVDEMPIRLHSAPDLGVTTVVATRNFFVGWNDDGIAVLVRLLAEKGRLAGSVGLRLLKRCRHLNQIGDCVATIRRQEMMVAAVDHAELRAWRCEDDFIWSLDAADGLLLSAAGHSDADPLCGSGWMMRRLTALQRRTKVAVRDVETALLDARLGDSTVKTLVVDVATRTVRSVGDGVAARFDAPPPRLSA
jgi:hypothetical protein